MTLPDGEIVRVLVRRVDSLGRAAYFVMAQDPEGRWYAEGPGVPAPHTAMQTTR